MRKWFRSLLQLAVAADDQVVSAFDAVCRAAAAVGSKGFAFVRPLLAWCSPRLRRVGDTTGRFFRRLGDGFRAHVPWSSVFGLMSVAVAGVAAAVWRGGPEGVIRLTGLTDAQGIPVLAAAGVGSLVVALVRLSGVVGCVGALSALVAFVRHRLAWVIVKMAAAGYALMALFLMQLMWSIPAFLNAADEELYPSETRNELWVHGTVMVAPLVLLAAVLLLLVVLRSASNFYRRESAEPPALGDRIWGNLRTHGSDPKYRKALYRSGFLHFFFIFLLPFLLPFLRGCESPYGIPKGSGSPVLQVIRIKKIKKKIEKKYVFNMNTAISFFVPKIDDSEVFEEVEKLTEDVYEAQQIGKLGAGGGKTGGWPNGMENAKVRFIRLEYSGGDWDQDMGFGSDYNMLLAFREITGFNIWPKTESVKIGQLERFPRKRAPPFVYMTGGLKGRINVSQAEVKTLRKYCLKMGGMIFADNGGGNFDGSFRALMRRVFPDLQMVTISYDDIIFSQPFVFPKGAPPLWHHSGNDAQGIKYRGRWVVFYHQGDVNDAWKDGHSGASDGLAMQACKLGINVINYGFNQYMQINFGGTITK